MLEGAHQSGASRLQFSPVMQRELPENLFSPFRQANQNLPVIFRTAGPFGQTPFLQTVEQFHRAVVLDLKALSDIADGRDASLRKTLQSQQQLVVLRLKAGRPRRLFAEMQESPDLMAELRQSSILGIRYINPCFVHSSNYIVMRYEMV